MRGDNVGEAHWGRLLQGAIGDLPVATKARGKARDLGDSEGKGEQAQASGGAT